ncbi:porin family protein [Sulfurovum sp. XTW-4]|uniref:Porin family protein n=1 Tax=Sulfurovum xiamenensis TaxID=3019066 RepID=A0ABT7QPX1_9BACT|nr:porin family protein [Sulfurovum xiamenensis]MDM5262624.1 porin family protein [Sulfurovum xiamenensis]
MKKIVLSVWAVAALSSLGFAGGDMKEVEPAIEPVVEVVEAEKNFYVGVGFAWLSTGTDSIDFFNNHSDRDRTGNLLVLAGYEFNEYMAVEGRYSTYMFDEDSINSDTWGIYAKPQYPVNEEWNLYALLGFGGMTVDGIDGKDIDVDDSGFQWGLGVNYAYSEDIGFFVDFVSIANGMGGTWYGTVEDVDTDAITAGITYNF